jgi:MFS family permease
MQELETSAEGKRCKYSIDEALESVGFGWFQWILLALSAIGFFATTTELIAVTFLRGPFLTNYPDIDNQIFAFVPMATFAGELVGGLTFGLLSDRFGRRLSFLMTAACAAIFGIAGALAPGFYVFVILRFFLGIGIGGSLTMDFIYFIEFVPTRLRGYRTPVVVFFGITAFFYTALIGELTLPNWRLFVLVGAVPYALLAIGRFFWRWESPRFLLTKGRTEEAQYILSCMASANGTSLPPGQLSPLLLSVNCDNKNAQIAVERTSTLIPTVTVSALFFCQTFSYYGLTIWFRAFTTLRGIEYFSLTTAYLIIGLSELPGLAFTTWALEKIGRRTTLMINFLGSAVCTALLITVHSKTSFFIVFGLTYFFIVGTWTSIYVATPEMLPTSCRATAFSIAGACGKLAGVLSPFVIGSMIDGRISPDYIVATIAGGFLLACLTGALLLVETRRRNLNDF